MTDLQYKTRRMNPEDIPGAMMLKEEAGWNQTTRDWEFFLTPPNICMVADHNGLVTGTAAAIIYGNRTAWISMVLVSKKYRGRGIAGDLLNRLMDELSSIEVIRLDATPEGKPVYSRIGFEEDHEILRMVRSPGSVRIRRTDRIRILPAQSGNIREIAVLDHSISGTERLSLSEHLIRHYPDQAWIAMKEDRLVGYALGRKGSRFFQTGPVGASSYEVAVQLIQHSLEKHGKQPVIADIPAYQEKLYQWMIREGFTRQRKFTRMSLEGKKDQGAPEKQYLIAGPEYG